MIGKNGVPLIGELPYRRENGERYIPEGYLEAVRRIGGEVFVIDYDHTPLHTLIALAASLDAMIFTGGPDVDPTHYGAVREPECGKADPARDQLELALFDLLYARGVPILGICRGHQMINVAMGGTLIQDIPKRFGTHHDGSDPKNTPFCHTVRFAPGTKTRAMFGADEILTDSYHHQSIDRLAPGLIVSAQTADGVIEACEMPGDRFLMTLQWHPEKTLSDDLESIKPFEALRRAIH